MWDVESVEIEVKGEYVGMWLGMVSTCVGGCGGYILEGVMLVTI